MNELYKQIERVLNDFTERYDLNHGNGYMTFEDNFIELIVEAPNHSTISIQFDDELQTIKEIYEENENYISDEDILDEFIPEIKSKLYDFDVDEEFEAFWSRDFQFRPSHFLQILQEDEEFFEGVESQL